jgi:hypothetical protein
MRGRRWRGEMKKVSYDQRTKRRLRKEVVCQTETLVIGAKGYSV